jgi:hypothetical protein
MSDDSIRNLLRTLAETDASVQASPQVEQRLLNKFRSRHHRRRWLRAAIWAPLVPAAAALGLVFMLPDRNVPTPTPIPASINKVVTAGPEPDLPKPPAMKKVVPVRRSQTEEIVTEFFPLMDPAPPFERGQLLRVELPASAMQMVGLPVREEHLSDPVEADVLVGEEGLPRAIRFVKFGTR